MLMPLALSLTDSQTAVGAHDRSLTVLGVETGKSVWDKFAKHGKSSVNFIFTNRPGKFDDVNNLRLPASQFA